MQVKGTTTSGGSSSGRSSDGGFKIFVTKVPNCDSCPFYIRDDNKELQGKNVKRCMLRSGVSSAQYGGMDIVEQNVRGCPLKVLPCLENPGSKCPKCGCECGC